MVLRVMGKDLRRIMKRPRQPLATWRPCKNLARTPHREDTLEPVRKLVEMIRPDEFLIGSEQAVSLIFVHPLIESAWTQVAERRPLRTITNRLPAGAVIRWPCAASGLCLAGWPSRRSFPAYSLRYQYWSGPSYYLKMKAP